MTIRTYRTDLRCAGCVAAISPQFDAEPGIARWSADVDSPAKVLTIESDSVSPSRIGEMLAVHGYRLLGEVATAPNAPAKSSYFPLLLILGYLLLAVGLVEFALGSFDWPRAMRHFMAGFFLVFSFFKLVDVPAFASSFAGYDLLAGRWIGYGYAYPFIELALGAAYLANVVPLAANIATLLVMGLGTIGVLRAVLAKRAIRCACLGTVFNLPMSSVTLIEDVLMLAMAAAMLIAMATGGHG